MDLCELRGQGRGSHPAAEDRVDGGAVRDFHFGHHIFPLLLSEDHEGIQGLLDVGFTVVLLVTFLFPAQKVTE